jgi:hypothetical protein
VNRSPSFFERRAISGVPPGSFGGFSRLWFTLGFSQTQRQFSAIGKDFVGCGEGGQKRLLGFFGVTLGLQSERAAFPCDFQVGINCGTHRVWSGLA